MAKFIAYISPECVGCSRSFRLAERLVELTGRSDVVEVIDVTAVDDVLPGDLFAVPTWYVDGVRFSLGNPSERQLVERLVSDSEGGEDSGNVP